MKTFFYVFFLLVTTFLYSIDIKLNGVDNIHINENLELNTSISTITTLDVPLAYAYSLVDGDNSEDNSKFTVENNQLKLNFSPDYEIPLDKAGIVGDNNYSIRLRSEYNDGNDVSSAYNNYGGFYNADNHPNTNAFAALKADGSIVAWGDSNFGGNNPPSGTDYIKIYSTSAAFVALKSDGSLKSWGNSNLGGANSPSGTGFLRIFSNEGAFAALKSNKSIVVWGNSNFGGTNAPSGSNFIKIYSTSAAFAALKTDGSIVAWGSSSSGGANAPTDNGYKEIYSNKDAFVALKANGELTAWGNSNSGGSNAPSGTGYLKVFSTSTAFAALKTDGSIIAWGDADSGGANAPTDNGYIKIYSNNTVFVALKNDGSISAWGNNSYGALDAPTGSGYKRIYSTENAFATLSSSGRVLTWGYEGANNQAPTDTGYIKIYSNSYAFAALKSDGSIRVWGGVGGFGGPGDNNYSKIHSNKYSFVASKDDDSIFVWGNSDFGGANAPSPNNYSIPYGENSYEKSFNIKVNDIAECGDSKIGAMEACDDGNLINNDGCSSICEIELGWQCDNTDISVCTDLNECLSSDTNDCSLLATCTNKENGTGFDCKCNDGYRGDGVECIDIDECLNDNGGCDINAICRNTQGSFDCDCDCDSGYHGDGLTCKPLCGDGIKVANEQCDDNNTLYGDGCNNICKIEIGWNCTGDNPQVCVQKDTDEDGIPDNSDNCPLIANPKQYDGDKDGLGNECDDKFDTEGSSCDYNNKNNTNTLLIFLIFLSFLLYRKQSQNS